MRWLRRVDMLKVDPGSGEADLFAGGASWLARVERLMMEFHPEVADPVPIAHAIRAQGFTFYPAGTLRAAVRRSSCGKPSGRSSHLASRE